MNDIFQFFSDFPLLPLIILFFVFRSFLSSKKPTPSERQRQEAEQARRSNTGTGTFGQPSTSPQPAASENKKTTWQDLFFEEEEPEPEVTRTESSVSSNVSSKVDNVQITAYEDKYKELQERKDEAVRLTKNYRKVESEAELVQRPSTSTNLSFRNLSSNQVIQGVIWSEVIGKPKSRQRRS